MKILNPLLPIIIILILTSCSHWHIGTGDKRNNLVNWKIDRLEKKAVKDSTRYNVIKLK